MQYRFPKRHFIAKLGDREIANTKNALVLSEVGYAIYEPVIYFPESDVALQLLEKIEKTTHCPLKGDTAYFNLAGAATNDEQEIAWQYDKPLEFAAELQSYLAFDPNKINVAMLD